MINRTYTCPVCDSLHVLRPIPNGVPSSKLLNYCDNCHPERWQWVQHKGIWFKVLKGDGNK